ncbi:hypothetical protein C2845_PM14G03670 [Panicum miliaceum]|uniref:DUF569 domain-containing protein n=1 Tax=Panicum miliaceum TaxID=4540 RepID=A0A3L6PQT7_PANMI|nr:hypothetical protein C2845_PM14G03670 [Panicum miliaceum]
MEVFEGVDFVRLRSLEHGTYLHAAEDGRSVHLDALGASPHAAWAVQRNGPLHPCRRRAATQRDRDEREVKAIMWRAVATGSGAGVVLLHDAHGRFLRANWRRLPCRSGVAVGDDSCLGPTTKWAVEVIPPKHGQPELPLARDSEWVKFFDGACPPLARLRGWVWAASQQREIQWVLADGVGNFREEDWASSQYSGRSAILLRSKLAHLTLQFCRLTLFIRAGRHGQLTPLVTDLPRSRERLGIVVIWADAIAADQLIFPDVDTETEGPVKEDRFRELNFTPSFLVSGRSSFGLVFRFLKVHQTV